jgi:hypothetical protein
MMRERSRDFVSVRSGWRGCQHREETPGFGASLREHRRAQAGQ